MQASLDIETKAETLNAAFEKHLGIKGQTLAHSVGRARRRLPKRLYRQAVLVADVDALRGNIKLTRQFDAHEIDRSFDDVTQHLSKIDRADARRGRVISVLAALAFNFIVVCVAVIIWLRLNGTI
ncbi:hypothetical protein [Roseobacter fucihabitans]|nr:hypothetical protein [Roseobacter litoralis]